MLCLITFSTDVSDIFLSYDAKVKTHLDNVFIISSLGAFIITSRTKLVGNRLDTAIIFLNSVRLSSLGNSPKSNKYATSSKPNLFSDINPLTKS